MIGGVVGSVRFGTNSQKSDIERRHAYGRQAVSALTGRSLTLSYQSPRDCEKLLFNADWIPFPEALDLYSLERNHLLVE